MKNSGQLGNSAESHSPSVLHTHVWVNRRRGNF